MSRPAFAGVRLGGTPLVALLAAVALAACSDQQPVATGGSPLLVPARAVQAFECTGSTSGTLSCHDAGPSTGDARGVVTGGQNTNVKLTSSNVSYNSQTGIFQFDVTVQNLMNEAMGTPDGTVADPEGIQVFFGSGPNVTGGQGGSITVANADGTGTFTGTNQPYFTYSEILAHNEVSAAKTWQLQVTGNVSTFNFTVYIETDLQYLLVINEVLANSAVVGGDLTGVGDYVELYNAGSRQVNLQGLVIADSSASGRRPYHEIASSLVVQPGAYVVLGNTTNTTSNGGVPVDYAYGSAINLAQSLDAFKIARVYGTDTLTLDRTQYSQASVSAKDGISRELKNPALDNSNMDGSNWGDASSTSVFGAGGRGTPKAQNSTYTP